MNPTKTYLDKCAEIFDIVRAQQDAINQVADWFAASILAGRVVHLFGCGHSRMLIEEMWPRYGSFPGYNPIVELSMTFHNLVVGANGQRQAMLLENVPGLATAILRNFYITDEDTSLVISTSGCSIVPIEVAEGFRAKGVRVVALVSKAHSAASATKHPDGTKLGDVADIVLDNGAPAGDAVVEIPGLEAPVAPTSTIGGVLLINSIKAEIAKRLTEAGSPPHVLAATCKVGAERAAEIFNAAYDEHGRRMAKLYEGLK